MLKMAFHFWRQIKFSFGILKNHVIKEKRGTAHMIKRDIILQQIEFHRNLSGSKSKFWRFHFFRNLLVISEPAEFS